MISQGDSFRTAIHTGACVNIVLLIHLLGQQKNKK